MTPIDRGSQKVVKPFTVAKPGIKSRTSIPFDLPNTSTPSGGGGEQPSPIRPVAPWTPPGFGFLTYNIVGKIAQPLGFLLY